MIPRRVLEDITRGAPLDPGELLGPLGATAVSERARANAELAQALFAAGRAREADAFAERAFLQSAFSPEFLPLYVEIQRALGRTEQVRSAYRRAGIRLAESGDAAAAIALFNLGHYAYEQAGLGDRYDFDFEIMNAVDRLARNYRGASDPAAAPRRAGPLRIAYLVFGAAHRGSVLVRLLCYFARHHDRAGFEARFFVPESPNAPRHAAHSPELRSNIALLESHGARVEAATARDELECWLDVERRIRDFGADVLVTTALLADYSHYFIAATRPARAVVGLGLGPPAQFAAPGLDWVVCATRHPMMDMPCDASVVEFEPLPPQRDAVQPLSKGEFGIPAEAPLVVVAGRPQKFLSRDYWAALSALLVEHPRAYLLALGLTEDPPFLNEVLAPAARARCRRAGWRSDYLPVLAMADLVIDTFPSGGGFVLTDAMALGIPVLGFRNDYLRAFNQTDWSPAEEFVPLKDLIVPRGDFAALRRAASRLIEDPQFRRETGERCRAGLLAARSQPERMVRRHEAIYEQVLKAALGSPAGRSLAQGSESARRALDGRGDWGARSRDPLLQRLLRRTKRFLAG